MVDDVDVTLYPQCAECSTAVSLDLIARFTQKL